MVYPIHGHSPLFSNSHVFVNVAPALIFVSSGIVTSRNKIALSLQLDGTVTASVGAVVDSKVGVKVAETKPAFVGINVAVTKPAWVGACGSSTPIEMQEDSKIEINIKNIFFFILFIEIRTSSSAQWIFRQGHWRFVLQMSHASIL